MHGVSAQALLDASLEEWARGRHRLSGHRSPRGLTNDAHALFTEQRSAGKPILMPLDKYNEMLEVLAKRGLVQQRQDQAGAREEAGGSVENMARLRDFLAKEKADKAALAELDRMLSQKKQAESKKEQSSTPAAMPHYGLPPEEVKRLTEEAV